MVFGRVNYQEGGGGVGLLSCAFVKKCNQTTDRNLASVTEVPPTPKELFLS